MVLKCPAVDEIQNMVVIICSQGASDPSMVLHVYIFVVSRILISLDVPLLLTMAFFQATECWL